MKKMILIDDDFNDVIDSDDENGLNEKTPKENNGDLNDKENIQKQKIKKINLLKLI